MRKGTPTVCFYDADCGVCTVMALWAARVARAGALQVRPNRDVTALPAGVTPELTDATVVVVTPQGQVCTRTRAVAAVLGVLPFGAPLAWAMLVPGVRHLLDRCYDFVAVRRAKLSALLGMTVCKVDVASRTAPPSE
ncbi:MAG: DUF393 domain-containing protein [Myxococcales bacterium]|nr:DUF393 domain-containing protein [Myxococcales bacterium]MDD9970768.1 DUF393 domain-containing protein [Myxococcales bacterium]